MLIHGGTGSRVERAHRLAAAVVLTYLGVALGVWVGLWGGDWAAISGGLREPASAQHWLGTNGLGQDILARLVASTATAFEVGLVVAVATVLLGAMIGALAGYFAHRPLDSVLSWLIGAIDAIPFYLFVAAVAIALRGWPAAMHVAMIASFWTLTARLVRTETMRLRERTFITAARVSGMRPWQIIWRHILPNTAPLLLVQATLTFTAAIEAEVVLSFLGIGMHDSVSWGVMLAEAAQEVLAGHYANFIAASVALFILVLAINRLADGLQEWLDPRTRRSPFRRLG